MNAMIFPMQAIAPTLACILDVNIPKNAQSEPINSIVRDCKKTSKAALLVIDALGLSVYQAHHMHMPYFSSLLEENMAIVRAVMPSATPFNFGCMATGAETSIHGLSSKFDDFQCETLFDTIRQGGKISAGLGVENATGNRLMSRYADIGTNGRAKDDAMVEELFFDIVRKKEADWIVVQYLHTDVVFHAHGPYSKKAAEAVKQADDWLYRCVGHLLKNGYCTLITADHGQHTRTPDASSDKKGTHGDDTDEDRLVPLTWVCADPYTSSD